METTTSWQDYIILTSQHLMAIHIINLTKHLFNKKSIFIYSHAKVGNFLFTIDCANLQLSNAVDSLQLLFFIICS